MKSSCSTTDRIGRSGKATVSCPFLNREICSEKLLVASSVNKERVSDPWEDFHLIAKQFYSLPGMLMFGSECIRQSPCLLLKKVSNKDLEPDCEGSYVRSRKSAK